MRAKPFIKWVGGKGQLIEQLDAFLPADFDKWQKVRYVEPFIGGGAMLFYMLQQYPNITSAVLSDINPDLVKCYLTIRDCPKELVEALKDLEQRYLPLSDEGRKAFFLDIRNKYNGKRLSNVENTAYFIYLNRTCFNGLYRVNRSGLFNVPHGKYVRPLICNETAIYDDSELLKRVEIICGDFEQTFNWAEGRCLFYFDPPYRPLDKTSSFTDYFENSFDDAAQKRLKNFCDQVSDAGCLFMLSNSDGRSKNPDDTFLEDLYKDYVIERVYASRNVNSNPAKRGKLTELLVRNYHEVKGNSLSAFNCSNSL